MKKSKEKPTYEELEKQLNKALSEAKHDKAELKKANKKIDDLELKINLLEYLNDPENSQKKQTDPTMEKNSGRIPRHTYRAEDIMTCLMLYVYCGCSYRSIPKALRVMRLRTGGEVGDLPDHTTVKGWVEKAGLAELNNTGKSLSESYAIVMDESISVGGFKLLLALGVPCLNEGRAVDHSDVVVLGMSVASGFDSSDVSDTLRGVATDVGRPPLYVLSDGGTNLVKGAKEAGLPHHIDVGHRFAAIMKKVYGEEQDFKELTELVGKTKHWSLDKDLAPLKAPNQRSLARYMNVFPWAAWLEKVLGAYCLMTPKERYHLGFVQRHASLAEELAEVCRMLKAVLSVLKTKGLSLSTARECSKIMADAQSVGGGKRMTTLCNMMTQYMSQELKVVGDSNEAHNISSDIIESCFGIYKDRRSKDKMAGITSIVLTIPLFSYKKSEEKWQEIDIVESFSATTISMVQQWRNDNLPESPNQLRKYKLAI